MWNALPDEAKEQQTVNGFTIFSDRLRLRMTTGETTTRSRTSARLEEDADLTNEESGQICWFNDKIFEKCSCSSKRTRAPHSDKK